MPGTGERCLGDSGDLSLASHAAGALLAVLLQRADSEGSASDSEGRAAATGAGSAPGGCQCQWAEAAEGVAQALLAALGGAPTAAAP